MIQSLYKTAMPHLLQRFREREEIVKMDVFTAFKDMLRQSQSYAMTEDRMEDNTSLGGSSSIIRLLDVDKVIVPLLSKGAVRCSDTDEIRPACSCLGHAACNVDLSRRAGSTPFLAH